MASKIAPAAVQAFIDAHGASSSTDDHFIDQEQHHSLAIEVLHNLKHQHGWTQLKVHIKSPQFPYAKLARPLLSGLPPRRLYIHPDEQIEHLQLEQSRRKSKDINSDLQPSDITEASAVEDDAKVAELPPVREWVLPTQIRETWTLSRLGHVFDSISNVPPTVYDGDEAMLAHDPPTESSMTEPGKWRKTKRLLLATVDDDSTIVYYIAHDGIVKPRQN